MKNSQIAECRNRAIARGVGMMTRIYMNRSENAGVRDVEGNRCIAFAARVREEAQKRNPILLTCGVHGNVVRFLAPITIQDEILAGALCLLEESVLAAREAKQCI